ncbi:hypothetical protein AB7X32_21610 [Morganella morganii]|uniref:hypothetical protein n=1 Tax=Morganella morganii TaxID=582 RepID=UPI00319FF633
MNYIKCNELVNRKVMNTPKAKFITEFRQTRSPRWMCSLYKLVNDDYELIDSFSDHHKASGEAKIIMYLRPEIGNRISAFFNSGKQS